MRLISLCTILIASLAPILTNAQDTLFIRQDNVVDDTLLYKTDTIVFPGEMFRHYLVGTTILPNTLNQQEAKGYGLYLTKVTKSDCKDVKEKRLPDKINYIQQTDTSLIIDISITANCCHSFLCDISIINPTTLNLNYTGYGNYCACECCFGLTYYFKKIDYGEKNTLKHVIINQDKSTLLKFNQ